MAEFVSVVGGLYATVSLDPTEVAAAQAALKTAGKSFTSSEVHSALNQTPAKAALNVYDINAVAGKTYTQLAGEQVIILEGSASATLTGLANAKGNLLIGNQGDDTINATGGTGTIIVGDGNNHINITGGSETVVTGKGTSFDTVVLNGGDLTIGGAAHKTVSVTGGSDTISSPGAVNIVITKAAALELLNGNDTVTASDSATVIGGASSVKFHGGTASKVVAGSGHETMLGGTGASQFFASKYKAGTDSMVGGSGTNLFVGGKGHDTMVSGFSKGSKSDIFEFQSSVAGGTHTITGYNASKDQIDLQGYKSTQVTLTHSGGNTLITLSDGTHITVKAATISLGQLHFT